jgi:site-specific DNA-methyltransferase (adenine-specific)
MLNIKDITNTIIQGDCLEVMKQMPDNCVDLTVTSPPYDNLRDYKGFVFDFEGIAQQLYRVTKQGGVVVWVVGDATIEGSESGTSFRQALYFKDIGFDLHDTMIYQKNSYPFPPSNRYFGVFEYMFVFSKGSPTTTNLTRVKNICKKTTSSSARQADGSTKKMKYETGKGSRVRDNIWKYEVGWKKSTLDKEAFEHPATFPEKLAKDHIVSWSNKGGLVLDPFSGSGTTVKMSELMGRRYIGIEISPEYCEIARKRVQEAKDSMGLFK